MSNCFNVWFLISRGFFFSDPEIFNLLSSPFPKNFIVYFLMKYMLPQRIFCSQIHSPWISFLETGESHIGQWPMMSWTIRFSRSPGHLLGAYDGGQGCTCLLHHDLLYFLPHLFVDKFPYSVCLLGILMRALSSFLKRGCSGKKAEASPDPLPWSQTRSSTPVRPSIPADYTRSRACQMILLCIMELHRIFN